MRSGHAFGSGRVLAATAACWAAVAASDLARAPQKPPRVLAIWGDDNGTWNLSHNNREMMGYRTPDIDRIARACLRRS